MTSQYFALLLLLVAVASTQVAQLTYQEGLLVHPAAQATVLDPANNCVYVIFRREIKLHCGNFSTAGARVLRNRFHSYV